MIDYVVGLAFVDEDDVLLIRKKRPEWQAGLLNGLGGKIEAGETPLGAVIRESKEEAGLVPQNWHLFLTLHSPDTARVYFFSQHLNNKNLFDGDWITATDEDVTLMSWPSLDRSELVNGLEWIIPLGASPVTRDQAYLPAEIIAMNERVG